MAMSPRLLRPRAGGGFVLSYLVQSGGGGGSCGQSGSWFGPGAAGGAQRSGSISARRGVDYIATVGGGGAGDVQASNSATNGTASVFSNVSPPRGNSGVRSVRQGASNTDFSGGTATIGVDAGGGAGAGANGSVSAGGAGVSSSITGSAVGRGGGGGGGTSVGNNLGTDGGGRGRANGPINATSGATNTGGGGGGGDLGGGNAGAGGSGVVILSFPSSFNPAVSVGLTQTTATVGLNKVMTITAGTGTVRF